MKNISLSLATAVFLASLLLACNSSTSEDGVQDSGTTVDVVSDSIRNPQFTGRLYTSGLSKAEAEKLGLSWPVFQVSGSESYFIAGHDSLTNYIGQCIGLGEVEIIWSPDTDMVREQFTYNRGYLEFSTMMIMDDRSCRGAKLSDEEQLVDTTMFRNYRGTIGRMERPAPDIAYDYVLRLEKPFQDEHHPVQPGKLVKELPLFVESEQGTALLEQAISSGQMVGLKAAFVQGYAESRVLQVVEVQM